MDFYVLPRPADPGAHDPSQVLKRLGRHPVGTGPYRVAPDDDEDTLRLVANPDYRTAGLPKIREIVFHRLDGAEACDRFLEGRLHVVYGVGPQQVAALRAQRKRVVCLPTPSVWFLATNHRRPAVRNRNLRLAIAHAVRRRAILDACFEAESDRNDHAALSGPYPAGSWAECPDVTRFRPRDAAQLERETQRAKALADLARRDLDRTELTLKLLFPAGREPVRRACQLIREHVAEVGITLELLPVDPSDFYQRVLDRHDFDLAYWRHDFDDPTYWLEPLLDPDPEARRPGGPNFLSYGGDPVLASLLADLTLHEHFPEIQAAAHKVHEHVAEGAIVIPLWQLGTYVAVAPNVALLDRDGNAADLDPFDPYDTVPYWELKAE
jgi:ABC-type oligopeptide transport system substrate-binding subunit